MLEIKVNKEKSQKEAIEIYQQSKFAYNLYLKNSKNPTTIYLTENEKNKLLNINQKNIITCCTINYHHKYNTHGYWQKMPETDYAYLLNIYINNQDVTALTTILKHDDDLLPQKKLIF